MYLNPSLNVTVNFFVRGFQAGSPLRNEDRNNKWATVSRCPAAAEPDSHPQPSIADGPESQVYGYGGIFSSAVRLLISVCTCRTSKCAQ